MDSEVDQELAEWQSSESCDRWNKSSWEFVVSGIPQGSILVLALFDMFISSLDEEIEAPSENLLII